MARGLASPPVWHDNEGSLLVIDVRGAQPRRLTPEIFVDTSFSLNSLKISAYRSQAALSQSAKLRIQKCYLLRLESDHGRRPEDYLWLSLGMMEARKNNSIENTDRKPIQPTQNAQNLPRYRVICPAGCEFDQDYGLGTTQPSEWLLYWTRCRYGFTVGRLPRVHSIAEIR